MQPIDDADERYAEIALRNLEGADACFARLIASDRSLATAAAGLTQITNAALLFSSLQSIAGPLALTLPSNVLAAAPIVAGEAPPAISAEEIYFGMGCAAALLYGEPTSRPDRIAYARILAARLDIAFHRRGLRDRGYPLMRAVSVQRALSADPDHQHLM